VCLPGIERKNPPGRKAAKQQRRKEEKKLLQLLFLAASLLCDKQVFTEPASGEIIQKSCFGHAVLLAWGQALLALRFQCKGLRAQSCFNRESMMNFRIAVIFPGLLVLALGVSAAAFGQIEVNSVADTGRQVGAPAGVCTTGSSVPCPSGTCTECTLRAAIQTANTLAPGETHVITFASWIETNQNVPPASVFRPVNGYDSIGRRIHLDGTSHPDWDDSDGIPAVLINGEDAVAGAHGLNFGPGGSGSTVDAVTINNFPQAGIRINADEVTVSQSQIGTTSMGTSARPNALGILVLGDSNRVGYQPISSFFTPWPNLISGNSGHGVVIEGDHNVVAGNRIGVDKGGSSALANGGHGILVQGSHARIGDWAESGGLPPTVLTARNQIAGNSEDQIHFAQGADQGSMVCSRVGTNAAGTFLVGGNDTLLNVRSSLNTIGDIACRNVFGGGLVLFGETSSSPVVVNSNVFRHNYVGTNADGADLGATVPLVIFGSGGSHQVIGNTIGNGNFGLWLGTDSSSTIVRNNYIGTDSQNRILPIEFNGLLISGTSHTIGGQEGSDNVIGHTGTQAVSMAVEAQGVNFSGNWIGVAPDGTVLPVGAGLRDEGSNNNIGVSDLGNVIAGGGDYGLYFAASAEGTNVQSNLIGVGPDGESLGDGSGIGIEVHGDDLAVFNLNVIGHWHTGIEIHAGSHLIENNRIGTAFDGESLPNANFGIRLRGDSSNNEVLGNWIGHSARGIRVNFNSGGHIIGDNWIGVTPAGQNIGNSVYGIYTTGDNSRIGFRTPPFEALPNVFGYNGGGAIRLAGQQNSAMSNYIGVTPDSQLVPNAGTGAVIILGGAESALIGSTGVGRNTIAGNTGHGIEVREIDGSPSMIHSNLIGIQPDGSAGGNGGSGIYVGGNVSRLGIAGVPEASMGLTVANNQGHGIELSPDAGTENVIRWVNTSMNQGKAIDLGPGGRDQDPGDADTGPNNLQNFPEFDNDFSGVDQQTGQIEVRFRIDSDPANSTYPIRVDVYVLESPANPQGLYVGTVAYEEADAQTFVTDSIPFPGEWQISGDEWFAAVATDDDGNSSEMSEPFGGPPQPTGDQIFRDRFEPALELEFSFSEHLAPTFRHPRCETCHAVAATDFQRVNDDPPGVLPAAHPIVNASTDCTSCHTSALLPPTGTIDPGWQSAPASFDFRGLDDAALCNLASQPVSGHSPLEHMTEDRLVLWAVGDGRVPFSATPLPTAPPHDIPTWRDLINEWVDAGMPCD
jgi:hypothetical protein